MRHKKKGRQLGRKTKHRWALFRNLVTSLLERERIETTEAKAKEIRGFTDRMITLGKEGSLPSRRRALSFLRSKAVVSKLFADVASRFETDPEAIPESFAPGGASAMRRKWSLLNWSPDLPTPIVGR